MRFMLVVTCAIAMFAPRAEGQIVMEMTPELIQEAIADEEGETCYPLAVDVGDGDPRYAPDPKKIARLSVAYG